MNDKKATKATSVKKESEYLHGSDLNILAILFGAHDDNSPDKRSQRFCPLTLLYYTEYQIFPIAALK